MPLPRPRPGARPHAAPCAWQPCCSCPRCWRSRLTVRDPSDRPQDGGGRRLPGGWGSGTVPAPRSARPAVSSEHRVPPAARSPAPTQPGGARAPRAGSCRGSRHPRPAETSPLIISPDLMGFLCCNSSRHPLPAHPRSPARYLAPLQASRGARARPGGSGEVAGAESAPSNRQPAASPSLPLSKLRSTLPLILGPLATSLRRNRVGRWRDPGLGHLSPLCVLSGSEPRAQCWGDIRGPREPSARPLALLWAAATEVLGLAALPEILFLHTRMHTRTRPDRCLPPPGLPFCPSYPPRSCRLVGGAHLLPQLQKARSQLHWSRSRKAWPWRRQQGSLEER